MDVGSLASAMIASRAGQTQLAVAARMLKMNADSEKSAVLTLLNAAQANSGKLASAASGLGQNLDISV
jgi:hypothetical protein